MKTAIKAGLSVEKKKEIEAEFNGSAFLRERLEHLLKKKIDAARTECRVKNTYDSPNWALVQADAVGYERALEEVISLIK
jgi:hypothetical protein